jgi:hypothetical protein
VWGNITTNLTLPITSLNNVHSHSHDELQELTTRTLITISPPIYAAHSVASASPREKARHRYRLDSLNFCPTNHAAFLCRVSRPSQLFERFKASTLAVEGAHRQFLPSMGMSWVCGDNIVRKTSRS